jgi:putative oxidoreductase
VHASMVHSSILLALRSSLGAMILAHGYNKVFRGGKLAGTAGWFESIGMAPGMINAVLAAATEIGCGILLLLGIATPLAAGALVALMVVAIVTVHRFNGYFVFNKGQGVEYCLIVIVGALTTATLGAGRYSLDFVVRHNGLEKWLSRPSHGLLVAAVAGFGGAAVQLVAIYRPSRVKKS